MKSKDSLCKYDKKSAKIAMTVIHQSFVPVYTLKLSLLFLIYRYRDYEKLLPFACQGPSRSLKQNMGVKSLR